MAHGSSGDGEPGTGPTAGYPNLRPAAASGGSDSHIGLRLSWHDDTAASRPPVPRTPIANYKGAEMTTRAARRAQARDLGTGAAPTISRPRAANRSAQAKPSKLRVALFLGITAIVI